MKIIHTADLHLDSKIEGIPTDKSKIRREEILRSFEKLADYAADNGVKAVIIAGDMFDTARVTAKTRDRVWWAIKKNADVDFLYLSGNHDDENFLSSLEDRPSNLKIFTDNWTCFNYGGVDISGIVLSHYNSKTAYDTLNLDKDKYNVVVMHGQIAGYKSEEKSELISIPRLKDKNIDYLALGHIHTFSQGVIDNRGNYAYCGCLDGRGFDELGDKGFVLLDIEKDQVNADFICFSSRNLYDLEYSVEEKEDWYSASEEIIKIATDSFDSKSLIKVILTGGHKTDFYIDKDGLTAKLNERFFFAKVYDKTELKVSLEDYEHDKSVRGEFVRAIWESDLSAEEKRKVITCGLSALKGEELL